ncbi:TEA1-TY1 enhancer activator [Colletotrichum asianum]
MAPSSVQDLFDAEPMTATKVRNGSVAAVSYHKGNFEIFRRLVPLASDGKITHLNAGFMPPSNLIVDEAIRRFCSESLHHPSPKACWRQDVEAVRQLLARYINTDPSSIAFVRDTTEGLGSFIHGLKFEPGDNVVILDCEHPNQAFGWMALRPLGLEVRLVPTDPERPVAANAQTFVPYVDERTKAIGSSSIMFHSGQWNDIADVCSVYRPMGIHILADLTQQVGFADVDVQALGVSAAAFSLHKGLNTPTGFAALYVDSAVIEELDPTPPLVGYGGVASVSDSEDFMIPEGPIVFHQTARRYEHANMSFISAVAARAFLQFYLENCVTSKTACEYREVDRKRVLVSHEYVASLESRLSWFESFVKNLRAASPEQREDMLKSTALDDKSPRSETQAPGEYITQLGIHAGNQANLELGLEGSLVYHGATSIFRAEAEHGQKDVTDRVDQGYYDGVESNFESVMEHFGIGMHDEVVMKSLTQFFRWQYPHFMFIYREAFLRDHFGDRKNGKYWSSALLLSICALGALVSLDTKDSSDQFFLAAESIIMVTGIAFRMAQDLGFQRDPKDWVQHDSSLSTPEDVEIRRRIYWGCYISDKLISLILGRPVYLVYDEAEVQPIETLPEPPEMASWRPVGFVDEDTQSTKATSMIPYLHEQIRLSRIIERMMTTLFSPRSHLDDISRRLCFDNLNLELNRWRESLPDFAKWLKWGPSSKPIPGVVALHLLFHSARIALNYDQAIATRGSESEERSRVYCSTSATDVTSLLRTYRTQYGLQHAPLVFVYGALQACRSAKAFGIAEELQYLNQTLGELSSIWGLSREVLRRLG